MIGELDAGNPHVQFDEGVQETCDSATRLCPTLHGVAGWGAARIEQQKPTYRSALLELGVPGGDLADAADRVAESLSRALADERGRWLLGGDHVSAACEYSLTGVDGGEVVNVRIDRTFIDPARPPDLTSRWRLRHSATSCRARTGLSDGQRIALAVDVDGTFLELLGTRRLVNSVHRRPSIRSPGRRSARNATGPTPTLWARQPCRTGPSRPGDECRAAPRRLGLEGVSTA
jgi:hypothetical protein